MKRHMLKLLSVIAAVSITTAAACPKEPVVVCVIYSDGSYECSDGNKG